MKKKAIKVFLFVLLGLTCKGQLPEINKPFIEITGTSETEITPDEIYISITLQERLENKEKLLIDKQEQDLKQNLKELGIDLSNITLNNANADYRKIRSNKKDVINSKSYTLKVGNADMVAKVYERLDKINVYDAYISKLNHSRLLEFNKENRIKAIKAAKEKVDYLLAAVGKQSGMALQITETENMVHNQMMNYTGYRSARMSNAVQSLAGVESNNEDVSDEIAIKKIKIVSDEIAIKKIKIVSAFLVKYEILNK